jgi:hypothetical protein
MTVLLMIVAILGPGSGQTGNPNGSSALTVTEIGTFEDREKCKAAIASAHIERKLPVSGQAASGANIEYQFACVDRGQQED